MPEPAAQRRRRSPILIGAVIAAAGLVLGGVAAAFATGSDSAVPIHGDAIPNVTTVENTIKAYYGSASASYPNVGSVTVPARDGNYAKQMAGIEARAKSYLQGVLADPSAHGPHPAVVFDIDDTTLNTYDYELYVNFAYTPASNELFVDNEAFPAVYGMPQLEKWARINGLSVFFLTGRPEAQRDPSKQNLLNVGYTLPADSHVYLKQSTPPPYLDCTAAPSCTTIEYKSGTRRHIVNDLGYDIVADFGDQYSDLTGGYSGKQFKLPNPMYYLP